MNRYHPNTLHSSSDLLFFKIISRSLRVIKNAEELGLNLGSVFGESQRCVLIIDAFLERERDGEKGGEAVQRGEDGRFCETNTARRLWRLRVTGVTVKKRRGEREVQRRKRSSS